ncbi:restriction endonuclease subunit S [Pseudomonas aeruginosa]|uniref:restriction endonuclease subunit S n=1 Tax=Pseudomonas aeruginosa TaxID=287 RepID=UPI000E30C01B|nr:restriction endonuclease subunit S [Pseudomonas aeruginosa]ELO2068735.1 restriction endonuclease subunit S [Pseudomonas aeruginosa]MBG4094169.1 restriction endonuclease subunit S [Pseudomonas aeruginosa]MCO2410179.1 restriction endonuclease subunit S [Pseudomonas aeruginosa]MCO3480640.1 restriction endonuclease subunit S [Pseudomonas aeruginosa]MCO3777423.1 restriction endonuclease subunit S [Pseudomonas aeruginosa]
MEVRPGYKQTEVGVIPEDWAVWSLGEIGESLIGLTYHPSDVRSYGTLVLRSSNVQENKLRFDDNVFVDTDIPDRIMVRPGDILVCVRNGSRDLIGKSALIDDRAIGMTFGAFMAVFRSEQGELLHQMFQSEIIKNQINEHLGATINQITNKSLNSFRVPLPPTNDERRAIASALSDMDALLVALEQLVVKKRALKQAAMQQLLTGQSRLSGFHGEWEVRPLSSVIAGLDAGVSVNSVEHSMPLRSGEPCILKTSAIFDGCFDPEECKLIERRDINRARLSPRRDTIIISRMNTPNLVGEVGYVADDFPTLNLPDRLWLTRFDPNSDICARWLAYVMSSAKVKERIKGLATGTSGSMKNIGKDKLLALQLEFPTGEEQTAIATVLSDMDAELAALEQRLAKTRALKQGMMQELLTGRTRLV